MWHQAGVTNGPTESAKNLAKPIERVGFGMTNFRSWQGRVLVYAGRPDWVDVSPVLIPPINTGPQADFRVDGDGTVTYRNGRQERPRRRPGGTT